MREPSENDRKKVSQGTIKVAHYVMLGLALILQATAIIGFINEGLVLAPIVRQAGAVLIGIILLVSWISDRKAVKNKEEEQ